MHEFDKYLGTIRDELSSRIDTTTGRSMRNDTIIVYQTDNGGSPAFNYPLRGGKFSNLEGGVRVRSAIGGGLVPVSLRGQLTQAFFHEFDWFPTFCEAAGVDCSKNFMDDSLYPLSGTSMWSVLKNNDITKMPSRTVWVSSACMSNTNPCDGTDRLDKNAADYLDTEDV